jgi:hypothetical protein
MLEHSLSTTEANEIGKTKGLAATRSEFSAGWL